MNLDQLFMNNSDCYTTFLIAGDLGEEQAMSKNMFIKIAKQYAIEMCFKQRVLCSIVRQTKTSWSDGRMSTNNVRMKTQIEMKKDILNAEPPQELRGEE